MAPPDLRWVGVSSFFGRLFGLFVCGFLVVLVSMLLAKELKVLTKSRSAPRLRSLVVVVVGAYVLLA